MSVYVRDFLRIHSNRGFAPAAIVAICVWGTLWGVLQVKATAQTTAVSQRIDSWATFAAAMNDVATTYQSLSLSADVERIRRDIDAGPTAVEHDPPATIQRDLSDELSGPTLSAWKREKAVRAAYAEHVYRQARAALVDGKTSEGLRLLKHSLSIDSDFNPVRQMLGYVRRGEAWKTAFQARMDDAGKIWHDDFGWIAADHLARYEAGERYFRRRWLSDEDETRIRRHFEYAWEVESEHFLVKTNVSLQTAAALARRLESFHSYFHREYARLFDSPRAAREFLKPPSRRAANKHEVHYFASREEYVRTLTPKQQGVAISRGVYLPKDRVSYFFDDPDVEDPLDTLYHEVTHQLLFESDPKMRDVAASGGYWAVEGLACYLESYRDPADAGINDGPVVGDINHNRIYWARYRVLVDGYYLPLQQFDRLGMRLFQAAQSEQELRRRYSQSTGLSHFFLHYDNGRYRDRFLTYIAGLYAPAVRSRKSLQQSLGVPYELLDQQYRDYLAVLERNAELPAVSDALPATQTVEQ